MGGLLGLATLLAVALVAAILVVSILIALDALRPPRHTAGYAVACGLAVDPAESGLDHDEWSLDLPGGVTLPVWEIGGKGQRDEGTEGRWGGSAMDGRPPLTAVFVHDWGQSRIDMLAHLEPWDELCDRIVLYDLRGHGDAAGGGGRLGSCEDQDLLALLERLGAGSFILVGCGLGAGIAIAAATRTRPAGDRIVGVVAYGPHRDLGALLRGRLRTAGHPARPLADLARLWLFAGGIRPVRIERVAADLRRPLLVIHGTDDRLSPVGHAERLVDAAPDAVLHRVKGAGHLDARAVDPGAHDEAARRFVARCASPASNS
ncbi:MAG: alpha/beta fold hydrolase [Planctomycetota bacterium]|jgi:pimeloyl-ACP methyl ester carboxylesterase